MIPICAIGALLAIAAQAFFTTAEMAFTTVNRIKLRNLVESGDPQALKLNDFLSREGMFLGTTLVGTNISVVISSTLATRVFMEYFGTKLSPVVTTIIMVPLVLLFAEIIPKLIARQFSTPLALYTVTPLSSFFKLFRPLILAVNSTVRVLLFHFRGESRPWDLTFTKSDLKNILRSGHEAGEVEKDELELIHKVLDFGGKPVENSMIPLYRVSSISENDSTEDLKRLVALTGFSRVPVYRDSKNNIIGIINIYDVLFDVNPNRGVLRDFIREPVHVKQDDGLDIALTRLRHQKQPMGIVTNNDEKVVGMITIEDILEELVGNIEDKK